MKLSGPSKILTVINYIFIGVITASCLIPIVHIFALSFSAKVYINSGAVGLLPKGFNVFAYRFVVENSRFWKALNHTLLRVVLAVPLSVCFSIMVAYPLSKDTYVFPARKRYTWFFVITMIFNGGLVPNYLLILHLGLMDTIWALVLPSSVNVFNTLVLMNYMRSLPGALVEAANLDGAGEFTVLLKVVLPLCKPAIATITLFNLLNHWNSWYDGLLYNNYVVNYPLQTYLQSIITSAQNLSLLQSDIKDMMMKTSVTGRNLSAAQLFVSIIPVLLIYPYLQRYFTKGLMLGSVKG